ncbi:MAG: dihydropteroate synthase [bacterium]
MRPGFGFTPARREIPPPASCRGRRLDFSRVRVMGVINATPDSFSDGGRFLDTAAALEEIARMTEDGADIIDVGGESTRPGAAPVDEAEELGRVMPIFERLDPEAGPLLSIDTQKPGVARTALAAGAHIVNDVGGLGDPEMRAAAAGAGAAAVAVHMRGEPRTMQEEPVYEDLMGELAAFLSARAGEAERAGIGSVLIDPGIGFGKTWDHNLEILRGLSALTDLGRPVVIGLSRKTFVGAVTGVDPAGERLIGSKVAEAFAVWAGADVIRTHDVGAAFEAIRMAEAIARGRAEEEVRERRG